MRRAWHALPGRARLTLARLLGLALRLSSRRAGFVLVYHGVSDLPADVARELTPAHDASLFEGQLRHLTKSYEVVRAERLLEAVRARGRGRRFPVAVTFDDDLPTHVRAALPRLQRLGVPATFFLCGASLERPFAFWWERLQRAHDLGVDLASLAGGASSLRELALRIEEAAPDARAELAERLGELVGEDPPGSGMRATDVRALAEAGFGIGFHTLRHDRLPPLDDAALARALDEGRAALERAAGRTVTAIAYPHGRADERVARAAQEAGFELGFTGAGDAVTPDSNPLLLSRIEPAFTSVADFAGQLAWALRRAHR